MNYTSAFLWAFLITVSAHADDNDGKAVPIPILSVEHFDGKYEPTCLSNGFVGLRPGINPLQPAATYVAGFYHTNQDGTESLCRAPYPLTVEVKLGGQVATLRASRQSIDMRCGELTTELVGSTASGHQAAIRVIQFASRSLPCVVAQEICVKPAADTDIELVSQIPLNDAQVEVYHEGGYVNLNLIKEWDLWEHILGVRTDRGNLGIAVVAGGDKFRRNEKGVFRAAAIEGENLRLWVLAALVPDYYGTDAEQQACRMSQRAAMIGYDKLRSENRDRWGELWRSRIRVIGDLEAQKGLDAAFYYLHSEAHPSSQLSVAPFGLSRENYFGHIFWDADSWMFLPVVLADPEAGRQIVAYRRRMLDGAQKIASLYGCQGAQYPWEASPTIGNEQTPYFIDTGWAEQHVNHDIAIAQWQYCLVTNDETYMRDGAWPVLKGIAAWICSRGIWTDNGFEIPNIIGVDESVSNVTNGSHMNLTGKMALEAAIACANRLGYPAPPEWRRTADKMYLPMVQSSNVLLPYSGARYTPGKADDYSTGILPFLLVHGPPIGLDTLRATWDFEKRVQMEKPQPTSGFHGFSQPPMAATAAFFGERQTAREIFHRSWKPYWLEPFGTARECPYVNEYGNFLTNHGSLLQNTLLGFTGLRIVEGDWRLYPARLPDGWEKIECDRIWIKGEPVKLIAEHGKLAHLSPAD